MFPVAFNDEEIDQTSGKDLATALAQERSLLRTMIDMIPANIYAKDVRSRFTAANKRVAAGMGTTPDNLIGKDDFAFFPKEMAQKFFDDEQALIKSGQALIDCEEVAHDSTRGVDRVLLTSKVPLRDDNGEIIGIIGVGFDITERKAAEARMASGERLESIGRLAAGVAHEINTPIQYLKDSVSFIREASQELLEFIDKVQAAQKPSENEVENVAELRDELPRSLDLVTDGLSRIAEIVRSMKDFSHADQREMTEVDLNRAIESTLVIARSEYKYVAEVETEYGDLPPVICHGGQINQVVLNLVVNGAHAIGDVVKGTPEKGLIRVKTAVEGDQVVISISDTGGGIPERVRARIFEPFFTTKEVGRGTGQGLSIARQAVVDGHGGSLDFVTETGKGTTFYVRLPINAALEKEKIVA
jgi:two-component system NtrC family sensor kinase